MINYLTTTKPAGATPVTLRKFSDPLHEGLFTHKAVPVRRCRSSNDRLLAQPSLRLPSRRRPSSASSADSFKTAAFLSLSLSPTTLTENTATCTTLGGTANENLLDFNLCQVQRESPLTTGATLVFDGSASVLSISPTSSKKRARERVCLADLDITDYPGYITYFDRDGMPESTCRLDTPWDNSSDVISNRSDSSNSNSSSDNEETKPHTETMSGTLCKILFHQAHDRLPGYVSPPRVRPSSAQLRSYVQRAVLQTKGCKQRRVSRVRNRTKSAPNDSLVNPRRCCSPTSAGSQVLFDIFEDSTAVAADPLQVLEVCASENGSFGHATTNTRAEREANKENSSF